MKVRHLQTGKVYQAKLYPDPGIYMSITTFDDNWNFVEDFGRDAAKYYLELVEATADELIDFWKEG